MLDDTFIEKLKIGNRMITEIPSPISTHRRWVDIGVNRNNSGSYVRGPALGKFAFGPFYWRIHVFEFDHITYNPESRK